MRILLVVAWLFVGLGGLIYHYGPGQEQLEIDRVSLMLDDARGLVQAEKWQQAVEAFDNVLAELPGEKVEESQRVTLELAKAQMMASELPKARETLQGLLSDLRNEDSTDLEFVAEVQSALANSQYYMTWLMRLEGLPEEEWMPEIEAARQHYTQLTKTADSIDNAELKSTSLEDLESAIRLARMDLSDLQALPLPSQ